MIIGRKTARAERGFTLTEAAIVLGIMGLILGAIWVAAASVYDNLRVSTASNQLIQIVQAVRSMHATQNVVDANLSSTLVGQAGGMPADMITRDGGGAINGAQDVWGGAVSVNPVSYNGTAGAAFSITFEGVPQGACSNFLVRNTGTGRDSGLVGAGNAEATTTPLPLTLSSAVDACSDTTATGNNVVFTFRLKS